ncbi:hypothetical protein [Streptosporangium sp. KLBMP 9127]|nr:hypothetical protein [Streptosporangium sp. KLBMP 9127]
MRPQEPGQAELRGHWPSIAEEVQATYVEWLVEREIEDGCHGDWVASHREDDERVLRARDILTLRELLKDADATS